MDPRSPPPTPATDDVLIGKNVGGSYVITRLLGEGGMGKVYEAKHLRLPRRAAVKVLQPDLAQAGDAFERFQREAEVASSLGSRHIVQVFDVGTLPQGAPFMLMEFLEGRDLATHLSEQGKLGPLEVLRWMEQAVAGVSAAHEKNVVHRDLKPANLFIAREVDGTEVLKVVDFGLSKVRGISRSLTGLNLVGTPAYMSPEQIRSSATADRRTDIYALGVILFELLTGRLPFEHDHVGVLMEQISSLPPPSVRAFAPELPAAIDQVISRALQKNPADRYQTCFEFWGEAKPALRQAGRLAHVGDEDDATGTGTQVSTPRAPRVAPATTLLPARPSATHRSRVPWIAMVLGVLAVAALVAVAAHLHAQRAAAPVESLVAPALAPRPAPAPAPSPAFTPAPPAAPRPAPATAEPAPAPPTPEPPRKKSRLRPSARTRAPTRACCRSDAPSGPRGVRCSWVILRGGLLRSARCGG